MEDAQHFFGTPGVGFLSMLLIGAIAGWVAEKVTEHNHSIFTNILVGIAGSFVGGVLAGVSEHPGLRVLPDPGGGDRRRDFDPVHLASRAPAGIMADGRRSHRADGPVRMNRRSQHAL